MKVTQHLTTVEAIEKAALEVFARRGFDTTTVEEIAAAAGISRRTFFRYFPSKNDVPFGNFPAFLAQMDEWFSSLPADRPMFDALADGVLLFNRVHTDGVAAHRQRMQLILHTPALRANAALRNAEWLAVLARHAARCLGADEDDFVPQLVAQVCLAAANTAYEQWLGDESADLAQLVRQAFAMAQRLSDLEPATRPERLRRRSARTSSR